MVVFLLDQQGWDDLNGTFIRRLDLDPYSGYGYGSGSRRKTNPDLKHHYLQKACDTLSIKIQYKKVSRCFFCCFFVQEFFIGGPVSPLLRFYCIVHYSIHITLEWSPIQVP